MITPTIAFDEKYNDLSNELCIIENKLHRVSAIIAFLDDEMRNVAGLITDLAEAQLTVLRNALQTPPDERRYSHLNSEVHDRFKQIYEDYTVNFASLLKARDSIIEQGKPVELTREKRTQLETEYKTKLENKLNSYEEEAQITADTDLEARIASLEEQKQEGESQMIALMDSKTPHTDERERIDRKEIIPLKQERQKLLSPQVIDLFSAAQLGDLQYIEGKMESLGLFEKKKTALMRVDANGFAPIHYAAFHNRANVIIYLLNKKVDPNQKGPNGYTALHWAAKAGTSPVINLLIQRNADRNARGEYGRTPLHMAVYNGRQAAAKALLRAGVDCNVQSNAEDNKLTPLHNAVIRGNHAMVTVLIGEDKLDVNIKDGSGRTPLRHAAETGQTTLISLLLGHSSWKPPESEEDPNHPLQLAKISPARNAEETKRILENFRTYVPS